MAVVIGVLKIDLEANTATFSESMEKMAHLSARTAEDVKKSLTKLAAAGVAMASAIAGGTSALILHNVEAIESLEHMSQSAGTTIEKLSALAYAAKLVDLPTELLVKGLEKLAKASFQAQNGNVQLHDIFAKLGVRITDSNGRLKDTGDLFSEISPKFSGMADGAGKTALAIALFGRSGATMIPLLNEWGRSQEELTANARRFGLVIGPEVSARALQFNDTIKNLKQAWVGFGLQLTAAALPALNVFGAKLQEIAVKANIPQLAQAFGDKLVSALKLAGDALDFVVTHAHALKLVLEGLIGLRVANLVVPLLAGFGGGEVLLGGVSKFAQGALGIKELVKTLGLVGAAVAAHISKITAMAAAEGVASAVTFTLSGALSFLAAHPVALIIGGLTTLGVAMYNFRDRTFEAAGAVYKYIDAYTLLARFIIQRRLRTGSVAGDLALVKKEREASTPFTPVGPELGIPHPLPTKALMPPDTGIPKKDLFGEEIKKLDLGLITTARYLSVLDAMPDKIQAVTAAQKAQTIILDLDNKLWDTQRKHLTEAQKEEIRTKAAEEESLQALLAYGKGLVDQKNSTILATEQARALASAQLQGDEAVRKAAIDNAILGLGFRKTASEAKLLADMGPELRAALSAKANADLIESANKSIFTLQQEVAGRQIAVSSATQYTEAVREAQIAVKTLAIDQQIRNAQDPEVIAALQKQRDLIIQLTKLEFSEADAREAVALRSPIELYAEEIRTLDRQVAALAKSQDGNLTYGESVMVMAKQQDAFNKLTDQTVNMLLRFGTARDGVRAFFLDMQKSAQSSASIIYEALHSAFEKLGDNLTELLTGGKTNFGKMFQDIGKQMVHSTVTKGLQTGLGALGAKLGFDLGGALGGKPDGTKDNPIWVRMAAAAGLGGLTPALAGIPGEGEGVGEESAAGAGGLAGILGHLGPLGGVLAKLGGLFGGGSAGGGVFSMLAGLIPHAEGGTVSPSRAYLVGERGPEILMNTSGYVASNAASQRLMGGGGSNHFYTIDARGTDPVLTEQRTRAAIIAAHNSAISNSVQVNAERVKRMPAQR